MSANRDIKESIKRLANNGEEEIYSIICTVDNINETERTCDCSPIDGRADILGVRLMADKKTGFLIIPKDGSIVTVTMINNATGYLAMFSEIDKILIEIGGTKLEIKNNKITFNDGTFDGIIKINNLTTELNTRLNLIKTAALAALVATDSSITALGGVAAGASAWNTAIASYTNLNKSQYENTKIIHGQ